MRIPCFLAACLIPLTLPTQESGTLLLGSDLADGFYGDEVPFSVDVSPWLGLVRTPDGSALTEATMEWRQLARAEGADGPTFELSSSLDSPVALFSGFASLEVGDVREARPAWSELSSDRPEEEITLGDLTYEVWVESEYPEECQAEIILSDGVVRQAIEVVGVLGCGDPHFTIHWAGDLDGDDRLDLVTTFSMKYSFHPRQLYLSSAAAGGELVGLAGVTNRTAG